VETKDRLIVAGDIKWQKKKTLCEIFYLGNLWEFVEKFEIGSKSVKNYRATYMQTEVCFVISGDIKSPLKRSLRVKWYQALRILRERATMLRDTYIASFIYKNRVRLKT